MVLEIKSISCVESLKKIPEIFGLENGKYDCLQYQRKYDVFAMSTILRNNNNLIIPDSNWLNAVQYSLSTRTGTLVFAYETKIIVLSNKWDTRLHQFRYSITWSDELDRYDDITAILCLPIANEISHEVIYDEVMN